MEKGSRGSGEEHEKILTDVTVLSGPSLKAVTVISTNHVFARVSIYTRLPHTLICICESQGERAGRFLVDSVDFPTGGRAENESKRGVEESEMLFCNPTTIKPIEKRVGLKF